MIDIVFLLIIFFLVSSHLAKQENRMKLDLPSSTTAIDEDQDQPTATINVDPNGHWLLGGHHIDSDVLASSLSSKYKDQQGNLRVRIRTDQNVPYDKISPILGICADIGITNVVFAVYESSRKSK